MDWHHRIARLSLSCSFALALACVPGRGSDDGDSVSGAATTSSGGTTTTGVETTAAATSTAATEAATSTSTTAGSEGSTAAADPSTGPDEPFACTEDLTCNPGETCVLPCCGGPQPGCFELPRGGECGPGGTPDEGGVRCCQNAGDPKACMELQWCSPVPCMADPPYCATAEQLDCNGDSCSAPSCFNGQLVGTELQCSCK